ncbi:MAG: hypothetical protein ABSA23_08300 [Anaerolineales bacterium]|jgi:hypothetical protein
MEHQIEPSLPQNVPANDRKGLAIAGFILGTLSLCPWIHAFCGAPFAFTGLDLSILGIKSPLQTLAIIGVVISGISFVIVIVNIILGFLPDSGGIYQWIQSSLGNSVY